MNSNEFNHINNNISNNINNKEIKTDNIIQEKPNNDSSTPVKDNIPQNYKQTSIFDKYRENYDDSDGGDFEIENKGTENYKAAGMQIANTIMGAGILSIPIVMRYLGILLGVSFIIFIAFVTIYSVYLLIRCHQISGKNSYSMFAKITLGNFGPLFVKIIIIINNFGLCCAYFRIFGETLQTLFAAFVDSSSYLVTNWHNYLYILLIGIIMSKFIFNKTMSSFKHVAYLGITSVTIFTVSLVTLFSYKKYNKLIDNKITSEYWFPNCSLLEAFQSMPTVFLAFTFQFNVFPIYFSLENRNLYTMISSTKIGVCFCLIIFLITGLFGFLLFGFDMNNTILQELFDDMIKYKDISLFIKYLIILISISFIISCLTSFPVMFFSLKENLLSSFAFCGKNCCNSDNEQNINSKNQVKVIEGVNKESEPLNKDYFSPISKKIIIVVLYLSIITMTILIPKLKIIFHIVGSTSGNFISFIFPNLFYIKLVKMTNGKQNLILPIFLLIIGIIFLIISFVISIIKQD